MYTIVTICNDTNIGAKPYLDDDPLVLYGTKDEAISKAKHAAEDEVESLNEDIPSGTPYTYEEEPDQVTVYVTDATGKTELTIRKVMPVQDRVCILLNNALTYMAETGMKDAEIAQYIGAPENELNALGVLGFDRGSI